MIQTTFSRCITTGKLIPRILALTAVAVLILTLTACGSAAAVGAPAKVPHVGFLSISASPAYIEALRAGLRERGYVEGETMIIDWKVTSNRDELPAIAAEFVAQGVDLIIAGGTEAVIAAKAQTTTIPIVMTNSGDAVGTGLVASLARPGGNVTGSTQISPQISGKRVELLKEAIPSISRVGVLWHPDHPTTPRIFREAEDAVRDFGLELISLEVRGPSPDFEAVFASAAKNRVDALLVIRDPLTIKHQQRIVDLAVKYRIPAMYETMNFVEAGGLMLYGPSFDGLYRHAAVFVDKILKGANPAEMPVEHPTTFELVINQKAAEAIGLTFSEPLLLRTTQLIR
jgi:putative ABC transport system substrate-binding protein